jgi:hypothetical protein
MTFTATTKQELSKITRELTAHPNWHYKTSAGDNGTLVFQVES